MKKIIPILLLLAVIKVAGQSEPFSKRTVITGLNAAWEVVYGPNDSLWVTENKAYLISRIRISNGVKTTLVDLRATDPSINFTSGSGTQPQGGLMGLALHPNLYSSDPAVRAAKPWVYAAYVYERNSCPGTNTSCVFTTKIVRFTYNGNTLSSPVIVLDNIPGSSDHNSGRLIIGPTIESGSDAAHTQYRLYYTVGDMGAGQFLNTTRAENAQNVDIMEGKVLRINTESDGDAGLDAWVPNDNPFYTAGAVTPRDYVYSLGHRNAQGLVWGNTAGTDKLYSSEQQDRSDDEINIIDPGKNYGWDKVTGVCDGNVNGFKIGQTTSANEQAFCTVPANNYQDPIFATFSASAANMAALYADGNNANWPTIASSSIDFYSQNVIPNWHESLLVSSLKQDKVYRIKPNSAGTGVMTLPNGQDTISYFRGDGNRIRRIRIAPDGLHFYVARDAGSIMEYTYTGATLPTKFLSFEGKLISSGVAELTWDAITDEQHDYFEIERSQDGNRFTGLGRNLSRPYKFVDPSVQPGNNYYRLKQVSKDGTIAYSKEIKIVYDPSHPVLTLYPNPVSDYLNVRVSVARRIQLSIVMTTIEGKVVYSQSDLFEPGTRDLRIDVAKMPEEVYILAIFNGNKEKLITQKIAKLQ
jgi:PQQ-dependent dehydrogenase (s-GDH family)